MKWVEAVKIHLESLPGSTLLDDYSPGDESI